MKASGSVLVAACVVLKRTNPGGRVLRAIYVTKQRECPQSCIDRSTGVSAHCVETHRGVLVGIVVIERERTIGGVSAAGRGITIIEHCQRSGSSIVVAGCVAEKRAAPHSGVLVTGRVQFQRRSACGGVEVARRVAK